MNRTAASRQIYPISKRYRLMTRLAPFIALLPIRLSKLLRLSRSDKEQENGHQYGATYDLIFRPMKYRRPTLLEIGIGGYNNFAGGASLAAWKCYFPFAKIVGCDIEDKRQIARGGIHVHVLDQSSASDLAKIASLEGPFDIVIDDGSHLNEHQIFSFKHLFVHLKAGGIYVIEDVQTSYWKEYGGAPVHQQTISTCMGYFTELAKYLNYAEFQSDESVNLEMMRMATSIKAIHFEHNLIVIKKGTEIPSVDAI